MRLRSLLFALISIVSCSTCSCSGNGSSLEGAPFPDREPLIDLSGYEIFFSVKETNQIYRNSFLDKRHVEIKKIDPDGRPVAQLIFE